MKKERGFTFIEIILVILLTGIVASIIGLFLSQGFSAYFATKPIVSVSGEANMAMDNMLREIKSAESINSISSNALSFVNQQGETIVIDLSGTTLRRNVNGGGAQPLCNNVTSFSFAYFNAGFATTALPAEVRFITVSLTVSENNIPYSLASGTLIRKLL